MKLPTDWIWAGCGVDVDAGRIVALASSRMHQQEAAAALSRTPPRPCVCAAARASVVGVVLHSEAAAAGIVTLCIEVTMMRSRLLALPLAWLRVLGVVMATAARVPCRSFVFLPSFLPHTQATN